MKSKESMATNRSTISSGEILSDGAIIELLSSSSGFNKPDLLLWNGRKVTTVGPHIEHGGSSYEAAELAASLYRAVRLPSRCTDYGSAPVLLSKITDSFKRHIDLPDRESRLLAYFSISTWLADRLPSAPSVAISGPEDELRIDVLRLLSCFCRHPLMLAEVTAPAFRSLPLHLSLTLLLNQSAFDPNLRRLFRASTHRGLLLPGSKGSVLDLYGPKAVLSGDGASLEALGGEVIHISMPFERGQGLALDEHVLNSIANSFQPCLLMYRLKNLPKVSDSRFDVSNFTQGTARLVRCLTMCFPDDVKLAHDIVQLLGPQDEEVRERRYRDVNYAILAVLWGMIHHRSESKVRVNNLTKYVNAFLYSYGEFLQYSPEEIGWKLRDMQVPRHTDSSGRYIILGHDLSQRIHSLARAYALKPVQSNCKDCELL